jgi:hypothetical protein
MNCQDNGHLRGPGDKCVMCLEPMPVNPMGDDLGKDRLRLYAESSNFTTRSITIYTDIRRMAVELLRRRDAETPVHSDPTGKTREPPHCPSCSCGQV